MNRSMTFLNELQVLLTYFKEIASQEESFQPYDCQTLKQRIVTIELAQELSFLNSLVDKCAHDLPSFEEGFKARCKQRAEGDVPAIGFASMPHSITNELYWKITEILFEPKTMAAFLNILMPATVNHLCLSFPETIPDGQSLKKLSQEGIEPILELKEDLNALEQEKSFDRLSQFLISGTIIFDVRSIEELPLQVHAKLYAALHKSHPKICAELYEHNHPLRVLRGAIHTYQNKGKTPKEAIEELIKGLTLGGETMTGKEEASVLALAAIVDFFGFLNEQPEEIKMQLLQARSGVLSLEHVIENEIKKGKCIETSAFKLRQIIEANHNNPFFNKPVQMNQQMLRQLKKKFKYNPSR